VKHTFPAKAKITALVCSGRSRPNVVQGRPRFAGHQASSRAMNTPTSIPTAPHTTVAVKKAFTMASS